MFIKHFPHSFIDDDKKIHRHRASIRTFSINNRLYCYQVIIVVSLYFTITIGLCFTINNHRRIFILTLSGTYLKKGLGHRKIYAGTIQQIYSNLLQVLIVYDVDDYDDDGFSK